MKSRKGTVSLTPIFAQLRNPIVLVSVFGIVIPFIIGLKYLNFLLQFTPLQSIITPIFLINLIIISAVGFPVGAVPAWFISRNNRLSIITGIASGLMIAIELFLMASNIG